MTFLRTAALLALASALPAQVHCKFARSDVTCGPVLSGTLKPKDGRKWALTYSTVRAPKNAAGVLGLGMQPTKVPLPSKCFLLVQPLVLFSYPASNQGEARMSFDVAKLAAGSLYAQAAFDDRGLRTSNSSILTCK